jgi:hypothetical protein
MKTMALSLRQPWAWAVLTQGKCIENRQWRTTFRGTFLLHAAQGCTEDERTEALIWMRLHAVIRRIEDCPSLASLPRGGLVGRARVVDVLRPNCPIDAYPPGLDKRWHRRDEYGFVLADVEPLPFRPYRGMPGFFEIRSESSP